MYRQDPPARWEILLLIIACIVMTFGTILWYWEDQLKLPIMSSALILLWIAGLGGHLRTRRCQQRYDREIAAYEALPLHMRMPL